MFPMLRLKVSGLDDEDRQKAIKRSLGLVAEVQAVTFDPEQSEVHISGLVNEHLVVVHLANEGIEAHPVHQPMQHPKP